MVRLDPSFWWRPFHVLFPPKTKAPRTASRRAQFHTAHPAHETHPGSTRTRRTRRGAPDKDQERHPASLPGGAYGLLFSGVCGARPRMRPLDALGRWDERRQNDKDVAGVLLFWGGCDVSAMDGLSFAKLVPLI